MRILHLAWEYPPVLYGGLGRHVHALANAQARKGHDVTVITQAVADVPEPPTDPSGPPVRVLRTGGEPIVSHRADLLSSVAAMEEAFVACGEDLLTGWTPDVVHAHDWMVGHCGVELRGSSGAPLVATIHATEAGRNGGWVTSDLSTAIHTTEWWLANSADALIACSSAMSAEIDELFGVRATRVIDNGIDLASWTTPHGAAERIRAAHTDADPLIAYTGRVEWEKGVQTILEAMPQLLSEHPRLRLLVAGRGSYLPELRNRAATLGLGGSVHFLGWVSEEDLRAVVAAADLAVAPSLYEPFGLVALEATALGTPVVVADTGGLSEFADNGQHALTFRPGDADALACAILQSLATPQATAHRARQAAAALAVRYDWQVIATATESVYHEAGAGTGYSERTTGTRSEVARPNFQAPLGQLLDRGR